MSCNALSTCVGATFTARDTDTHGTSSIGADQGRRAHLPDDDEGFGLHFAGITAHKTTGGLAVKEVEAFFVEKMGNMTEFDAFMDFNVGLFTSNMDHFVTKFVDDAVPHLRASWTTSSAGMMYSVFVHVPKSQMVIELIASHSNILAADPEVVPMEQRLSDSVMKAISKDPPTGTVLKAVKVSRAATDLDALDAFYEIGMQTEKVLSVDDDVVSTRCYVWPNSQEDLCFVKRPASATSGHFKVGDFEHMLKDVQEAAPMNPHCKMNRWADNHYSFDAKTNPPLDMHHVLVYLDHAPSARYTCSPDGLHYLFDPTGWAIQLNVRFGRRPSRCEHALEAEQGGSPSIGLVGFCDGGACGMVGGRVA
jgi:hypothetical protein